MEVRLKAPWSGASAWARIRGEEGDLELELFDFSEEAQSSLGNDVAWTWRVPGSEKERVRERLGVRAGRRLEGDAEMLGAMVLEFANVHGVRDWLRAEGFSVTEEFDGWA